MRWRRAWWRRIQEQPAARCGWCGYAVPNMFGQVLGRHDSRFVGHGEWCPTRLYGRLRTASGVADQWGRDLGVGAAGGRPGRAGGR